VVTVFSVVFERHGRVDPARGMGFPMCVATRPPATRSGLHATHSHRNVTPNKCYATFKDFSAAMLNFLRDDVPRNWRTYCDEVTDNFRVIDPKKFQIIG
jgi:hypothetical protein